MGSSYRPPPSQAGAPRLGKTGSTGGPLPASPLQLKLQACLKSNFQYGELNGFYEHDKADLDRPPKPNRMPNLSPLETHHTTLPSRTQPLPEHGRKPTVFDWSKTA